MDGMLHQFLGGKVCLSGPKLIAFSQVIYNYTGYMNLFVPASIYNVKSDGTANLHAIFHLNTTN